jgi:hypothetical protein
MAVRLSYLAEIYQLLLESYINRRKQKSTEYVLYNIIDTIYEAWNIEYRQVVSLLLLDISKVFDNVSYQQLLYNLRKRYIDKTIV